MLALEIVPASLSYIKYLRSLSIKIFKETLANQVTGDDIQLYLKVNVDGVETNASTIVRNNQNKFKGWKCGITNKKILIQANGNVQYGVCENGGHIGNIFDPIELFTQEYSICHQDECHTIDEVMITKFKV